MRLPDGTQVVLDAGTGLRALGYSLPIAAPSVAGARPVVTLLLTHRHSDHVIGLAHFAPILTRSYTVRIACGGVTAAALCELAGLQLSPPLFPALDGIVEALTVETFDAANTFSVSASCRVHALHAQHPGGASVLVVHDETGPVVAYAPDNELAFAADDPLITAWRDALAHSLYGIPLLFHDATYTDDELGDHRGWGHSSAEEATQFALRCQAGTLLLTHHHPDRTDDEIDAMVARCRAIVADARSALRVDAAAEGMVLEVA